MPANAMQSIDNRTDHIGSGGRLVSSEGEQLPLESATLKATAEGGLARTILKQVFANPHREPLQIVYTMPLPAEGSVSGYQFRIGDRRISGEVKPLATAREDFERALVEGRTVGLLEQERANLFTQQLGNVPPGQKVTVELTVDQKLTWLTEGMWEYRFPTVAGPRYLGAEGRVPDAGKVTVDVGSEPLPVRAGLELSIGDRLAERPGPESSSHAISVHARAGGSVVTLASEDGARLDRDVVVRWTVPRPHAGVTLRSARRPEAIYGLLTIVPPASPDATLPRDLILLIDTSGSMMGDPLHQAKRVARSLIDSLQETDSLEMIAFSSAPRRWRRGAVNMTADWKQRAHGWLDELRGGGATEMCAAIGEALRPLRADGVRQVILLTDGYIGFESEVVSRLRNDLPANSRLHAVGIGLAVNTALLHPAARAGRGVEVIVGLEEDAERGAARLLAATRKPVVSDIRITGDALLRQAPKVIPDLLAGAPVLASLKLRSEGGRLAVRGNTAGGRWEQEVAVPAADDLQADPAIARLYAREAVEDLEIDLAAGGDRHPIDSAIERFGIDFHISTRLTSWVAVSDEVDVDPAKPTRRSIVPQELPHGTSAEGLGLWPRMLCGTQQFGTMEFQVTSTVELCHTPLRAAPLEHLDALAEAADVSSGFRGRWIGAASGDVQFIEFEVTGESLDWDPRDQATLVLTDGRVVTATIEIAQGTATGTIEPGCLVRLALKTGRIDRDEVVAVIVNLGDTRIGLTM